MKKNVLISILMVCILVSPFSVFAEETSNTSEIINVQNESSEKLSKVSFEYNPKEQEVLDNAPEIGCKSAYVANPETGKVFYEKNAHEKMYPASTTKILTALVVLENCKLDETATVSKKAISLVPPDYSNARLQVGEELSISDLLYALLIPSANEAANVLAEHVSGSVEEFAELCNKRAKELGCENLHFVNPNGMDDENHYCTAYDLYLIAKECQKFEIFREIVKTQSFTLPETKVYPRKDRTFYNTNSLILPNSKSYYYPYCTGIKTGYTTPAGECLVASSSYNNLDLISVVLGGKERNSKGLNERFYDTKQLFEFVYDNYSYKEIVKKNDVITTKNIEKATKDTETLDFIVDTSIYAIVPNNIEVEQIVQNIDVSEKINAPIEQNQDMGKVTFSVDGLNYTTELIASHNVEKIPYWRYNAIVLGSIIIILLVFMIIIKKNRKVSRH